MWIASALKSKYDNNDIMQRNVVCCLFVTFTELGLLEYVKAVFFVFPCSLVCLVLLKRKALCLVFTSREKEDCSSDGLIYFPTARRIVQQYVPTSQNDLCINKAYTLTCIKL